METAADRFDRRLAQEIAAVRVEISESRLSIIRWVAGLLIAQAGVIIGTVSARRLCTIRRISAVEAWPGALALTWK